MNDETRARNNKLQALCREYLRRLRYTARKHGIGAWLDDVIRANRRKECEATEREVRMLARMCDDERIARKDVHKVLGVPFHVCNDTNAYDRVTQLPYVGIYSKVSALLYAAVLRTKNKKKKER